MKINQITRILLRPPSNKPPHALIFTILCLQACATVTTKLPDGSQTTRSIKEFEKYAESVFRRQNQATVRIGELLDEDLDPSVITELEAAEEQMLKKCAAINQIARQQMDQQHSNFLLELEVKRSIGECDYATRQIEHILNRMQ